MSDIEHHFIKVEESLAESIASDFFSVASLCVGVWFNQTYCGGSYFLNGFIFVIFVLWLAGRASGKMKRFKSADEAIAYIQNKKKAA